MSQDDAHREMEKIDRKLAYTYTDSRYPSEYVVGVGCGGIPEAFGESWEDAVAAFHANLRLRSRKV